VSDVGSSALDPWSGVVGQHQAIARLEAAVEAPVHAYLFLGSLGSGSAAAAAGFAGLLLAQAAYVDGNVAEGSEGANGGSVGVGGSDGLDASTPGAPPPGRAALATAAGARHLHLALELKHPDMMIFEAEGAALRVGEAEQIIRAGLRSPVEGNRKIIIVRGVNAIEEAAIGKLLKVIEEPPPSAVFLLLAEEEPPELVTIASRCVTVEFGALSATQISAALLARGVDETRAHSAAVASGGDFERAMLLAADDGLAARAELWRRVAERLDGTGSTVASIVNELRSGMDGAQGPLLAKHEGEMEQLEERVEQMGERGSGRSDLVARHKRELRRQRADELRFGLATLSRVYRDRLVAAPDPVADTALRVVQATTENLIRNPNEPLLLQDLLLQVSPPSR